jgi:hypothetical protein
MQDLLISYYVRRKKPELIYDRVAIYITSSSAGSQNQAELLCQTNNYKLTAECFLPVSLLLIGGKRVN